MPTKKVLRSRIWNYIFLAGLIALLLASLYVLPMDEQIEDVQRWLSENRALAAVILFIVYVVVALVAGPVLPLQLAAGLLFGFVWGFIVVMVSTMTSAFSAFMLGRYVVRDLVRRKLDDWPKLKAIDGAIASKGFQVVLLLRVNPILPFGIQNYFFAMTPVKLRLFLLATALGSIPGSLLYSYAGAVGRKMYTGSDYSTAQWVLLASGLVASAAAVFVVARHARKAMRTSGEWGREAVELDDEIRRSFASSQMVRKLKPH